MRPTQTSPRTGRCAYAVVRLSVGQASHRLPSAPPAKLMRVLDLPMLCGTGRAGVHPLPSSRVTQYSQ